MFNVALSKSEFLTGWLPALAVAVTVEPPRIGRWIIVLGGFPVPIVASALALLGVLAARPLAARRETELGRARFWLVSAIMMLAVELWVLEAQPGWLFTFVVAIGVGFSGYSLIELLSDETTGLVKSSFAAARTRIGALLGAGDKKDKS